MRKLLASLLVAMALTGVSRAQKSSIPTFPDDSAELVDPGSLDVPAATTSASSGQTSASTSNASPASSTASTASGAAVTTKTVADASTGTPTLPVVSLPLAAALITMTAGRFIHKKLQR